MKKTITILLAVCLVLGLTAGTASAAASDSGSALQIVQALGIINGDENGNLNLSNYVTRAEFAKMMIAASSYKDTISSVSKSSPFKDVKYTHWAASYIQTAVTAGWLSGYTDGTYRPDNNVTLEEAVSAVLKMLGYTSSDFTGSFPEAQLAKYYALGLNTNISAVQGQALTREECMYLFYNLMSTENSSGKYYAETLGYTVNDSGELDYSSLVLANLQGPFIVESSSWSSSLPFSSSVAAVYKDGLTSSISAISTYDVYYYNSGMKTVWAYDNRVSGVYTAASPSTAAPTSVTVAGTSYTLSTSTAAYEFSNLGSFHIGDSVTLLLGMDGGVVGAVDAYNLDTTKYGFVTATGTDSYTDGNGVNHVSDTVTVACTDGEKYQYEYDNSAFDTGDLVKITFSDGVATVSQIGAKSLTGTVNTYGTALGSYSFSSNIQIVDSTENGSFVRVYPDRIAGLTLSIGDVRYYVLDDDGDISQLILNNVTGDLYSYGIMLSASGSAGATSSSGTYKYMIDGVTSTYNSSSVFSASTGPIQIEFNGSAIVGMRSLSEATVSSLNTAYAVTADGKFTLGDGVQVYICRSGSYYLSSVSAVSDMGSYTVYGFYDQSISEGGRIRVIVAYAKS